MRRLELLLGEALTADLSADAINGLVSTGVSEDEQLDFKLKRYETNGPGREELAKDVCAFANRLGGVLILGVAETKGVATAARPLDNVNDADARHIRSVLASWCAPVPDVEIIRVSASGETGFIVVVVPPSPRRPHAVAPPASERLGWPVRHGTQTRWLTESEIADAYKARASRILDEEIRLGRLADEAIGGLVLGDPWLVAVLVPAAGPAATPIDAGLVAAYRDWLKRQQPEPVHGGRLFNETVCRAGPRRVIFTPWSKHPLDGVPGSRVELHTDGAGVAALQLRQPGPERLHDRLDFPDGARVATDEQVANFILAALQLLTLHALDNAGCWAEATALLLLTDGGHSAGAVVDSPPEWLAAPVVFGHWRHMGFFEILPDTVPANDGGRSTATIDIAAVATRPAEALAAAHLLGGGLLNIVGHPELAQFTANGQLRNRYFAQPSQEGINAWATKHDLAVVNEAVTAL